jgi:hypothetical protein
MKGQDLTNFYFNETVSFYLPKFFSTGFHFPSNVLNAVLSLSLCATSVRNCHRSPVSPSLSAVGHPSPVHPSPAFCIRRIWRLDLSPATLKKGTLRLSLSLSLSLSLRPDLLDGVFTTSYSCNPQVFFI